MKKSPRNRAQHHLIDGIVFAVAAAILLTGCFATKAQVIENDSPAPDGTPVAQPTPPPLEYFKNMSAISGITRFSIDVVHQSKTGDSVIASGPATVTLVKDVPTTVTGWAVDYPAHRTADAVYLMLDRKLVTSCHIAIARPDVASALQDQVFVSSGFSCMIPPNKMLRGRHKLTLGIVAQGGHTYYIASPTTAFVVR